MAPYMDACLSKAARSGHEVYALHPAAESRAPFQDASWARIHARFIWNQPPSAADVSDRIQELAPDIILCSSWNFPFYRQALRGASGPLRIVCMDNQWLGTVKQHAGVLISKQYLHRSFDGAWVAGRRQEEFAQRLGFTTSSLRSGVLAYDESVFFPSPNPSQRVGFVYVGAPENRKGFGDLIEAYRLYRRTAHTPWPLVLAGANVPGQLRAEPGVSVLGFLRPKELAAVLRRAGAVVMPGRFEAWGVAAVEAAACGTPLILSSAVGASPHILSDQNGMVVAPGAPTELARALSLVDRTPTAFEEAHIVGPRLVKPYTTDEWVTTLASWL